jgi:hypothetical protein
MIDTNGTTVTTNSVTLRKNAADTTLLVSFTTATGLLEDTTHTVTGFAATDKLSTKIINGATAGGVHNIILCWVAYSVTGAAAAAVPLYLQPIFMEWVES